MLKDSEYSEYKELCITSALIIFILLSAATVYAGEATLTWDPPTTNADGTPLTDLAGYKVYYGTESGNYSQSIDVGNVTTYTVSGLTNGQTYYFAVTAYDTSGNESDYSNERAKTIESSSSTPVPDITVTDSIGSATDLEMPFGDVTAGNSSAKTVTVKNDGNADLSIGSVAGSNPVEEPFSISDDTCSGQVLKQSETCKFTVSFSPVTTGMFNDSFDIPSNDTDENPVTIAVSGGGLSAASNNPPTTPALIYPANGQKGVDTTVEFRWKKSIDPDGDPVTYYLYYDNDRDFTDTTPLVVTSLESGDIYYAGIAGYGAGLVLLVMIPFLVHAGRSRKKILTVVLIIIMAGILLISCGDVNDVISDFTDPFLDNSSGSRTVSGLASGATYCWKVVAEDGDGGESESSVNCFETK